MSLVIHLLWLLIGYKYNPSMALYLMQLCNLQLSKGLWTTKSKFVVLSISVEVMLIYYDKSSEST